MSLTFGPSSLETPGLIVDDVLSEPNRFVIKAHGAATSYRCPACGCPSTRVQPLYLTSDWQRRIFVEPFGSGLLTIGRDYLTKVDSLAVAAIEGALSLGYSRQLGGVWKGGSGSSIIVVMWPAADAASDDWRWFDV